MCPKMVVFNIVLIFKKCRNLGKDYWLPDTILTRFELNASNLKLSWASVSIVDPDPGGQK